MSSYQHVELFKQAMSVNSIEPPDTISTNGAINRFGRKKKGWYVFHEGDISGGSFGFWGQVDTQNWCSKQANEFSASERDAWRKQQAELAAQVKAETLERQAEAAKKAVRLWSEARPDVDLKHAYLESKGIYPHGVKQLGKALLLPVYDQDKSLVGCQFIYGDGTKVFITGTKKKGSFCCLKPVNYQALDTQTLFIVEGWATGVSVLMAMDCLIFVAFDCGNLESVAVFVRGKYPQALIVIAGDNDESGIGLRYAIAAAKAVNGLVVIPK